MDKKKQGAVHYLCFYFNPETEDKIVTYPSVISKIDYIVDSIKATDREVRLVSIAPSKNGYFGGYKKQIDLRESHIYLPSIMHGNSVLRKICFVINNFIILFYLVTAVQKEDTVLVYHSLYNRFWLSLYKCLTRKNVVLQIEDVYSELTPRNYKFRSMEWGLLHRMKKCLCVNDIVYKSLSDVPEKVVSYGSYSVPPLYEAVAHDTIRLVYAGVIEQERKAAFWAVETMRYLTDQYELCVLGFGKDEDINALKKEIADLNVECSREVARFCGKLSGESYWRFLQNCDIALSTHSYTHDMLSSANHTFPSKVLTYLANGLPVVAQKLDVLELSAVSNYFSFYDEPRPEEIAKAILAVDTGSNADPRAIIADLDSDFQKQLKKMLEG